MDRGFKRYAITICTLMLDKITVSFHFYSHHVRQLLFYLVVCLFDIELHVLLVYFRD